MAGNHDLTLDTEFYEQHGQYYHNNNPQSPEECQRLVEERYPSLIYLKHTTRTIKLDWTSGPRTTFSVFGSPFTPKVGNGLWAFQYDPTDEIARKMWCDIPLDTDILITHGPARMHRDDNNGGNRSRQIGCEGLRQAMWRVRPRIAVCGHVHEGRGAERVQWDLESHHVRYKEKSVDQWLDPGEGNNKMCLVDLSTRGGKPLDNDGTLALLQKPLQQAISPAYSDTTDREDGSSGAGPGIGTDGLGGNPASPRSDRAALVNRLGRAETCIVNCAIMSGSYPHIGPRRLKKPIVVDIDLPIWTPDLSGLINQGEE